MVENPWIIWFCWRGWLIANYGFSCSQIHLPLNRSRTIIVIILRNKVEFRLHALLVLRLTHE